MCLKISFQINQTIVNAIARPGPLIKFLFATAALGMYCDLRHVRRVVHTDPPLCMEGFFCILTFLYFFRDSFTKLYFNLLLFIIIVCVYEIGLVRWRTVVDGLCSSRNDRPK